MRILIQSINCIVIEDTWRLYHDIDQVCWQGTHLNIALAFSIPGIILWAFGIPILGFFYIRSFRREVADHEHSTKPMLKRILAARLRLCCGFLTLGYEDKYYYWEIVIMLRKTILVLIMVLLAPYSSGMQSLLATLFLGVCLVI